MIRCAGKEDAAVVYEMICLLEDTQLERASFMDIYHQQQADAMYTCLLYEEKGKVLGVLNMRIEGQLHHASPVAEIMELVVREDARSQGIGRTLLEAARKKAAETGCVRIELSSSIWRRDAHRFYENNGFRKTHYNLTSDIG